jgi:putative ABC transport system permease protein
VAVVMMAAVAGAFFVLWGLGLGAAALAGRLRGFARGAAALGLANLSGPGSAARTASPAIGFGVALLTTVVLIQSSLLSEVRDVAPAAAPSLIFTQIPPSSAAAFDAALAPILGGLDPSRYRRFPFLTGRIVGLKGRPVDRRAIAEDRRWAFDQDVTMSSLGPQPHDPDLAAGAWWPQGYVGPPLVMLDADVARAAGLKVGDELTLSVLGRDLDARISGLRRVDFGSFGASFPIIIDPDAMKGANLRDIAIAKASARQESAILERLAAGFSNVNVISVREQLAQVSRIFGQLAWAVRGAAAVASLAGLLVLVGAVAATAKARAREAALLKVLGSTRLEILGAYGVEYGAVGSIAGVSGVLMGAAAAYPVTTLVFRSHWSVDWSGLVAILALTALVAGVVGAIGAFLALSRRPAGVLRAE